MIHKCIQKNTKKIKNQMKNQSNNKKENYRSTFLMNIETKFLNRILANRIWKYIKRITHHDQVMSTAGMQGWFNIEKSINITHHINKLIKNNHTFISDDAKKSFYKSQNTSVLKTLSKQE